LTQVADIVSSGVIMAENLQSTPPLDPTTVAPQLISEPPSPVSVGWFTRLDDRVHIYLSAKFPRAIPVVSRILRLFYAICISPAFAVVLALLLVGFVISGEVTIIVSLSAICAWLIACLSIAKAEWVNRQRIGAKVSVLILSALILFFATHKYVDWCLRHYSMNKAKQDKDQADQESKTIKGAFVDSVKNFPIQSLVNTAPSHLAAPPSPVTKSEAPTKTKKQTSPSPTVPQNAPAPSAPTENNVQSTSPQVAQFLVTQSTETPDNPDEPNKIAVVVQTNLSFPSLRLAIECDGPISHGNGGIGTGVMMMTSQGVVNGYPNIYLFTYQSATPQFGPSSPLVFRFWSQNPIRCIRARTF
jgi:hypothetical protein